MNTKKLVKLEQVSFNTVHITDKNNINIYQPPLGKERKD